MIKSIGSSWKEEFCDEVNIVAFDVEEIKHEDIRLFAQSPGMTKGSWEFRSRRMRFRSNALRKERISRKGRGSGLEGRVAILFAGREGRRTFDLPRAIEPGARRGS
ncbi:hypothetical protein KM043_003601 [Ampulex compressa]|nr:hypothetical protein KM043_003601 [Ampulex compressa]